MEEKIRDNVLGYLPKEEIRMTEQLLTDVGQNVKNLKREDFVQCGRHNVKPYADVPVFKCPTCDVLLSTDMVYGFGVWTRDMAASPSKGSLAGFRRTKF